MFTPSKFITSWDDATKEDQQLVELLLKYKIPAIFFIPNCHEVNENLIKWLDNKDFIIGGHTVHHYSDLKEKTPDVIISEIEDNKTYLEDIVNHPLEWFCFPRGRHNVLIDGAVERAGYKYARTTIVGEVQKKNNLIVDTSVHVLTGRKEYGQDDWFTYAVKKYNEAMVDPNGMFHLWGHSREMLRNNEFGKLEAFFQFITTGEV